MKDAVDFSRLKRVLVVKLRHHGDVLLTSPVFTVLKSHYPHLQVDALVYQETAEMLSGHPAIDQLHLIDRRWKERGKGYQLVQEWRLARRLAARRYDLLVMLTEQWRGALLRRLLKIPYGVVADYGRRQNHFWKASFTHFYPQTPHRHKVEFHLDALRRLGLRPHADEKRLSWVSPPEDREHIDRLLAERQIDGEFLVVHPGSRRPHKCWEPEKYAALIERLQKSGHTLVLTGAPSVQERQLVDAIVGNLQQPVIDLSGALTLKQLGELIRRARCFIGVDSAPMHMAAAVETPIVALFGPSKLDRWHPWSSRYEIVSRKMACQPCSQHGCANSEFSECIANIGVQQVMRAVERILATQPDLVTRVLVR